MSEREDETHTTGGEQDLEEPVQRAREEVIEALERTAEVYGAKRSYGRLYGILFFADEPLSLDELADESGYAKSTVSTAMTALERFHLVHRRSIPGEGKKAYFEAETDFWHVFQQFLAQEVTREIRIMNRALDAATDELESADSDQAQTDLEKIQRLRKVYDRSERMVSIVTSQPLDRFASLFDRFGRGSQE